MARLIDADSLVEKWQARHDFFVDGLGGFDKMSFSTKCRVDEITNCVADVVNAPTVDAVEVVRCKDCKHAYLTYNGEVKYCEIFDKEEAVYLPPSFFCAYGERRNNEH